jgi:hypothetical protein
MASSGRLSSEIASVSVATGTIFISFLLPLFVSSALFLISAQFAVGVRNIFTPYFLAPIIFSAIPPIGPT